METTRSVDEEKIENCIITGDGAHIPAVVETFDKYFDIHDQYVGKPIVARGCALVSAVDHGLSLSLPP